MRNEATPNQFHSVSRAVWAVDPLRQNLNLQTQAVHALESLETTPMEIEPVYVLHQSLWDHIPGIRRPHQRERQAKGRMRGLARLVTSHLIKPLRVLHQNGIIPHSSVRELCEYARQSGAELIAVLSGGFAEELIYASPVSVLVSKEEAPQMPHVRELIFPTDFSGPSCESFERAVSLAAQLKAKLCLMHHFEYVYDRENYPIFLSPAIQNELATAERGQRETAEKWLSSMRERGVSGRFILSKHFGSTSEAVLKVAHRLPASLIVMGFHPGHVTAPLLASLTCQVVRHAKRPVLVLKGEEICFREE